MSKSHATDCKGIATVAVHGGFHTDPITGAVNPAICTSSTFAQDGVGELRSGLEYSRSANPTRTALEACLAAVEGGIFGRAFSSGMAASDAALRAILQPGDEILIPNDAYGGTFRLIHNVLGQWKISYKAVDLSDIDQVRQAISVRTKLIWVESPTNPLLSTADIQAISVIAHQNDVKVLVDNTFASPALQHPLALGADIVVHSTTKYISGHSDAVGGGIVTNNSELDAAVGYLQNAVGAVPSPFDAYLVIRGLKTLPLRMQRHCENAMRIAEHLVGHREVTQVLYPGLPNDPGHLVAARQTRGFGGIVSMRMRGGRRAAQKFCARTELFILAESVGAVESLIEHPALMTHASTAGSPLEVPDDLVRLSVGIEQIEDLLDDLDQALRL